MNNSSINNNLLQTSFNLNHYENLRQTNSMESELLNQLPPEIIENIAIFLDCKSQRAFSAACYYLNQIVRDKALLNTLSQPTRLVNSVELYRRIGYAVKELTFRMAEEIAFEDYEAIVSSCSNLLAFASLANSQMTDTHVDVLIKNCKQLRWIDLQDNFLVTYSSFVKIAMTYKNLHFVNVSNTKVNDELLKQLASANSLLQFIELQQTKVTDLGISHLAANCSQLQGINLSYCDISEEAVKAIAKHCSNLKAIDLSGIMITDQCIQKLARKCNLIKEIILSQCLSITDKSIYALALNCPNLIKIDLSSTAITSSGVIELAKRCNQLMEIHLAHCYAIEDSAIIALAKNCSHLKILDLSFCDQLTNQAIENLALNSEKLENITLYFCSKIQRYALEILKANSPRLKTIFIEDPDHLI